jgi:hypothetical protein
VGLFNRKQILRCHWCGNKLKDKEEYREPDNTQTILCRNCFDKALDKLINQGGTRVQSPSDYSGRYNDFSSDYKNLSDREISKKKFNAYLNPGTDEAEFRRNYKTRYRAHNKTEYDKGKNRVKRILDKKDKDDK